MWGKNFVENIIRIQIVSFVDLFKKDANKSLSNWDFRNIESVINLKKKL
jgi:hypothetical protein